MKKYFITGLVLLLPITLTIAVIGVLVNILTKPFVGFVSRILQESNTLSQGFLFLSRQELILYASKVIILICIVVLIFVIGMIARWFFIHWIIKFFDTLLHKVPLVNKIYKTIKEVIHHFFGHGKNTFKQVVMVPFPSRGIYMLGFLSKEAPKICQIEKNETLTSVFIPTSPNPSTGYLLMYQNKDIQKVPLKPEEALKYIVSCGLIASHESQHPQNI